MKVIHKFLKEKKSHEKKLPIISAQGGWTFLWFRHMVRDFDVAAVLMMVGILLRTLWSIDRSIKRDYLFRSQFSKVLVNYNIAIEQT